MQAAGRHAGDGRRTHKRSAAQRGHARPANGGRHKLEAGEAAQAAAWGAAGALVSATVLGSGWQSFWQTPERSIRHALIRTGEVG